MSSRYGPTLHARERDPYDRQRSELLGQQPAAQQQAYGRYSPAIGGGVGGGGGYGYASTSDRVPSPAYRAATPNRKGQYSASVMEELEAQNDDAVEGLSKKVRMLKDITVAIGEEVRSSTTLMEAMNESFEGTREKLQGTMKNMLRMARRTGVGWKAWIAFFAALVVLFWWVWI
ncbi:hypothetical protein BZA05DRAFT_406454 [Tricharina praecox]|uniref:uncharacterized protein n=1 Tax=Tricharina praecox TaxID=43433 RepID=UPI002220DA34|nr:uncharacterized protein BZA05DRAFT_413384 [Tricharina praecox]XP_051336937.1 uncharacterized protein BZA05DRAFT_406454 [Tricharina praecox]KAI5841271.1 hypothetical protein BZA05DRAFT_413384 [Tricharina praecox]KAI5846731.1 hypothetical protein BZA05DRAFT_406454 [Tricharina praecox]